ncbi:hypothetical protein V8E54_003136 [Elaphomyces granulatus]
METKMGHGAETTFNMYFKSLFDARDEECDNENEYNRHEDNEAFNESLSSLARNSPRITISTTSTAASSTSANAATNFTTDVLPEPASLQIQDNGNDLEEAGGDDFRASVTVATTITTTATVTAATTAMAVAATAAATAATTQPRRFDGRDIQATCMCGKLDFSVDKYPRFATRRPGHYLPRRIRFQCESEAARTAQRTKSSGRGGRRLLVVVILRNWQLRRHLCLLYKLQRL